MAAPFRKTFRVTDDSRRKTYLVLYEEYWDFVSKCKEKFGLPEKAIVHFVSKDANDAEADFEILVKKLPAKSLLIMKEEEIPFETDLNRQEDAADVEANVEMREQAVQEQSLVMRGEEILRASNNEGQDSEASHSERVSQFDDYEDVKFGTEVKEHAEKFGLNGIGNILKNNLMKWRKMPLNIAVTGGSGKGKSSLINALLGLQENDPGAAKVGVLETTTTPTSYKHPGMENFLIWDVPGVGTKHFPKESYIKDIHVDRFDFFIIVISERITETDSWLFQTLKLRNPFHCCYIVRTKVDNDLNNEKRKGAFDERDKFVQLKKEFLAEIKESIPKYPDFSFFLISNHHTRKFDFPDLENQLLKDVPIEKRSTIIFGMANISHAIVKEKATALRSRVWKIALLSGTGAALIPIPLLSNGIDVSLILEEVMFYRDQFGLYDESLKKISRNLSLDELKAALELQTPFGQFTVFGISQLLQKYVASQVVEQVASYTIPVIGSFVAGSVSYTVTSGVLNSLIMSMEIDTLKIVSYLYMESLC